MTYNPNPNPRTVCSNKKNSLRQFHLKRFEYDPYLDDLAKIHDRFEFPTKLDMSPWLKISDDTKNTSNRKDTGSSALLPSVTETETVNNSSVSSEGASLCCGCSYYLSAVVMHVGGSSAGHYYAYVRYPQSAATPAPSSVSSLDIDGDGGTTAINRKGLASKRGGGKKEHRSKERTIWVKLDDQRVTQVPEAEVLRDAFGGGGEGSGGFQGLMSQVIFSSNKRKQSMNSQP